LGVLLVAGLDERLGWSPEISLGVQVGGLAVVALGCLLSGWAMLVNRFFSAVVRIQSDRGHSVVSTGPYRLVRHPAYVGGMVVYLATGPALVSLWALVPGLLVTILLAVRTALEDRTLRGELPGYEEYASRVRYRLIPGIW
jgi:protein-S-isoprenylcysteine O-methyltransferase Ste14